jgi:hypothetical protein
MVSSGQRWASSPTAAGDSDGPGRGLALPRDEAQQCGLARTIAPDESDALRADSEGEAFKQRCGRFGR